MKYLLLSLFLLACASPKRSYDTEAGCRRHPFFLVLFVDAKHFDYRDGTRFLRSFFDSDDATFGHAWIYLQGVKSGNIITVEGGHSGEISNSCPRYMDQVIGAAKKGMHNPVQHLFIARNDGYYEVGSGGHKASYAILVPLTEAIFDSIYARIEERRYPFTRYSIIDGQCTTFVREIAAMAGLFLEDRVTLSIPQKIRFDGAALVLWHDPSLGSITFATPDVLEQSMVQSVREGRAFAVDPNFNRHPD